MTHSFYPIRLPFQTRDWVILLEIALSSLGYVLFFQLLKIAGAVFYSLVGGMVAITGLFWGWLLFNERLSALSSSAVVSIIIGIWLVALQKRRVSLGS